MKVVLFGASGMIGSRILKELQARGHQVTAAVREPSKLNAAGLDVRQSDILDPKSVEQVSKGADAVISAYSPGVTDPSTLSAATKSLIAGVTAAGVRRLLMVGGAGSLEVAPGLHLVDAPDFPPDWKSIALAHRDALALLKNSDLDWTSLSPAAMIEPGVRTGTFRTGKDELISDSKGESRISAEDYAVALVNELESPGNIRQRFTVGY